MSAATIHWLRAHAGLVREAGGDRSRSLSIADCLEKADLTEPELDSGVADLLDAMAALNGELNGATPSEARAASQSVPRDAAYAVGEVIRLLHDAERSNVNMLRYGHQAWLAETAWLAVLAGDVDDLRQHLLHEQAMREA